jgi:hypothetical protein
MLMMMLILIMAVPRTTLPKTLPLEKLLQVMVKITISPMKMTTRFQNCTSKKMEKTTVSLKMCSTFT